MTKFIGAFLSTVFLLSVVSCADRKSPEAGVLYELIQEVHDLDQRLAAMEQAVESQPSSPDSTASSTVQNAEHSSPVLSEGQTQYEAFCTSCHKYERGGGGMLAPPVFAVADHYQKAYPNREDRIAAIVDFVKSPTKERSVMPGAVRNFNLMPPMPLPDDFLRPIAEFLADTDFSKPQWYAQHYQAEHGVFP